jgi:hypothetical protein
LAALPDNAWLQQQEADESKNNATAQLAVVKKNAADALALKLVAVKADAAIKSARIAKLDARLAYLNKKLSTNTGNRQRITARVAKVERRMKYIAKKRQIVVATLKRLALRQEKAAEAAKKAEEEAETTSEDTIIAIEKEQQEAAAAIKKAKADDLVLEKQEKVQKVEYEKSDK